VRGVQQRKGLVPMKSGVLQRRIAQMPALQTDGDPFSLLFNPIVHPRKRSNLVQAGGPVKSLHQSSNHLKWVEHKDTSQSRNPLSPWL